MDQPSPTTVDGDQGGEESKERKRCICPDCGKAFKDLKTHMITHKNKRPAKCPVLSCEYHTKGFARKYDRDRHALTHYKGTMVCSFCPGSGTAAEQSFNRSDAFKKHLVTVHEVEQTLPNNGQRSGDIVDTEAKIVSYAPDATGNCSTCPRSFSNAQDFYDHLDDCVLQIIQQEDPAEAINADRLAEVEDDEIVHQTLRKNHVSTPTQTMFTMDDEEGGQGSEEDDDQDPFSTGFPPTNKKRKVSIAGSLHKGTETKGRGRKSRRDYPSSWGYDKGQVTMKRRVMSVFNGPRRLAKDDMMLSTEHEVRIKLSDGKSYVTDLDVQTMKRAEVFHSTMDDQRSNWPVDHSVKIGLEDDPMLLGSSSMSLSRAIALHQGSYFHETQINIPPPFGTGDPLGGPGADVI